MRGEGFAILAALLWGVNYPLVKSVLGIVPENDFLIIRFLLAGLLFLGYLLISGEDLRIASEHRVGVLLLGVLGVGVYNIVWTCGIHRTTAANAALLISASPIFTGLFSLLRGEERISFSKCAGTIMAFAGIGVIINWTPGAEFRWQSGAFAGNILVLGGAVLFSMYAIMAKPLLAFYSPAKLTALAMLGGLPVILINGFVQGAQVSLAYSPQVWAGLFFIIVMGTVVAFIFWYRGIQQSSPFRTVIFHYIVPVVSMIVEGAILGEVINRERILGGILVFAGLLAVKRDETVRGRRAG